jgi:hypothetical protein
VVDYSFPPTHPTPEEQLEERKVRREERLAELERTRHRLPPFIVLPFPGPFKHVRRFLLPAPTGTDYLDRISDLTIPTTNNTHLGVSAILFLR